MEHYYFDQRNARERAPQMNAIADLAYTSASFQRDLAIATTLNAGSGIENIVIAHAFERSMEASRAALKSVIAPVRSKVSSLAMDYGHLSRYL